jgi:hypothetical protein
LAKAGPGIRSNEHIEADGETVFRHACEDYQIALATYRAARTLAAIPSPCGRVFEMIEDSGACGWRRSEPKGDEMNDDTDDLHSDLVNREYWIYLRLAFLRDAKALSGKAQAIVERLAATTDDVPAQLVQEQQQFWNDAGGDNTWERFHELEDVHYAMIEEIARGESAPENATVFVVEFIRRVTGGAGVLMSFGRSSEQNWGKKKWR